MIYNLLYIDPGTGMILIQLILAGIASVYFSIKKFPKKIKNLFKRKNK